MTVQSEELIEENGRLSLALRENELEINSSQEKIAKLETLLQEADRQAEDLKLRLVSDRR